MGGETLSVVIPAYNEARRLPAYLREMHTYLRTADLGGYEVTVVDDGSADGTDTLVRRWSADWPELRLLRLPRNRGKGAAVREGVLASSCDLVLFADADGATPIDQEARLRRAVDAGADVAVASRLVRDSINPVTVSRSPHRAAVGRAFARLARAVLPVGVLDTQCGFKMFRREAGHRLMRLCHEDGFLLDLEALAHAARIGLRVAEVAVDWHEVPGSKVSPARDAYRLALGLVRLRRSFAGAPNLPLDRERHPRPSPMETEDAPWKSAP